MKNEINYNKSKYAKMSTDNVRIEKINAKQIKTKRVKQLGINKGLKSFDNIKKKIIQVHLVTDYYYK